LIAFATPTYKSLKRLKLNYQNSRYNKNATGWNDENVKSLFLLLRKNKEMKLEELGLALDFGSVNAMGMMNVSDETCSEIAACIISKPSIKSTGP